LSRTWTTRSGVSIFLLLCRLSYLVGLFLHRFLVFFSVVIFPESQERAEAAVAKVRVEDPASNAAPGLQKNTSLLFQLV
jgi:hypothetical protein